MIALTRAAGDELVYVSTVHLMWLESPDIGSILMRGENKYAGSRSRSGLDQGLHPIHSQCLYL